MKKCELIDLIEYQKENTDKLIALLDALVLAHRNEEDYLVKMEYALMGCSDMAGGISKELGVLVEMLDKSDERRQVNG